MKRFIFIFLALYLLIEAQNTVKEVKVKFNPQQQEVEYTADDDNQKLTQLDSEILTQIEEAKKVMLNTNHSQRYNFLVNQSIDQQFIFAVDVDEEIQAVVIVYWDESDDMYAVSKKAQGQQVKVFVYEDGNKLLSTWDFYHAGGITFHAKKNHQYIMKITTKGKRKMLVMDVEHFISKGSSQGIATKTYIQSHEQQMYSLNQRLVSYMGLTEQNHVMNGFIADNVRLHMKRYMVYQIMQFFLILVFSITQGYFIRRLLSKGYSLV